MLLKLTNRLRSRSNTSKNIYISLSLEFIEDVKLLFRFLIFGLVSELWPKDWTPMTEFSDFGGVFQPSWPSQTKIKNSGSKISIDHFFGGFAKIWLKSVGQIRRIFAEKRKKEKHLQNITQRHCAGENSDNSATEYMRLLVQIHDRYIYMLLFQT